MMKFTYFFIGLAILLLAGGSFYYTNILKNSSKVTQPLVETPHESTIFVYREYGDVSFKNKGSSTFTDVKDTKMLIENKATVKTGNGRGYVIFPDNSSITLSSSTEIEINYEPTKVSILQLLGLTYYRVTSLATGHTYEIRTPNTLAAIRGTKLAVLYNPKLKKTFVAVTEHSVEVTPLKENGKADDAPVIIQEGSTADVESATGTSSTGTTTSLSAMLVVRNNNEVPEVKPVIDENKILDKEYDSTPLPERVKFLEKVINLLQKENTQESSLREPTKTESEADVINRILNKTDTKSQAVTSSETKPPQSEELAPSRSTSDQNSTVVPKTSIPQNAPEITTLKDLPTSAEVFTPDQEAFIDSFYASYEKYFLVRDATTYCKELGTITPKEMVEALLAISNKAGYTLPHQIELSSFANSLVSACADGSIQGKVQLFTTQFDVNYPY